MFRPLFGGVSSAAVALLVCVSCLLMARRVEANIVYTGNILKCEFGQVFVIGGATTANATGFWISLRDHDDYIFQLVFRIAEGTITRHTNVNGTLTWEQNEHLADPRPPSLGQLIEPGRWFTVTIGVGSQGYLVAINDVHYCTYAHRQPPGRVRSINVAGDVRNLNQVDHRSVYPRTRPLSWTHVSPLGFDFNGAVPEYLRSGHRIDIRIDIAGLQPQELLYQFRIWLQGDYEGGHGDAIVLMASFSVGGGRPSATVPGDRPRFVDLWEMPAGATPVGQLPLVDELRPDNQPAEAGASGAIEIGAQELRLTLVLKLVLTEKWVGEFEVLVDGQRFMRLQPRGAINYSALSGVRLQSWNGYTPRVRSIDHTPGPADEPTQPPAPTLG